MRIAVAFKDVSQKYPDLACEVITKLRRGKSKSRGAKLEELSWGYDWSVRIDQNYIKGPEVNSPEGIPGFVKARLNDVKNRIVFSVIANVGRWTGRSNTYMALTKIGLEDADLVIVDELPEPVEKFYREVYLDGYLLDRTSKTLADDQLE